MTNQTELKGFNKMDESDVQIVADCCSHKEEAVKFMHMINGKAGHAFFVRYLMRLKKDHAIDETDQAHLLSAIRFCYAK